MWLGRFLLFRRSLVAASVNSTVVRAQTALVTHYFKPTLHSLLGLSSGELLSRSSNAKLVVPISIHFLMIRERCVRWWSRTTTIPVRPEQASFS